VLDLGCVTGYWCAWLGRMGARPVGLDVSEAQLETARALQRDHGLEFPLLHASAESTSLADRSFDLVLSEYGAIWCEPYGWTPEAHRLLRPGGRLIFRCNSVLMMLCSPPARSRRTRRSCDRSSVSITSTGPTWRARTSISPTGEMLRLLRQTGFEVEALHELQAPGGPEAEVRFYLRRGWARRWPGEEVWVAQRRPARTED
jgi:SAM-dependent methyltransferase